MVSLRSPFSSAHLPDKALRASHLRVQGHGETLHEGGEHQTPLPPDERKLDGEHGKHSTDDTGQVDVNVLPVCLGDGSACLDIECKQQKREVGAG
jgi:hypothetical protein